MIRFLNRIEISDQDWDNCIDNSINGAPYAYSWYLDRLCPGWCALVDHDYRSVFPLPVSAKMGINYIYTPVFIQRLGLFSQEEITIKKVDEFVGFIPEKYQYLDLAINVKPSVFSGTIIPRDNQFLKLDRSYEEIRNGYTYHCKRNIKIAKKNNLVITEKVSAEDAYNLFRKGAGRHIKNIRSSDYLNLVDLMGYCLENGTGKVSGIRMNETLIYSLFSVYTPGRITLQFISTSEESRKTRAGYFAIDNLIKENASSKLTLDFAGSSIKSIADYNNSYGGSNEEYYRLLLNKLPWPVNLFKK